MKIPTYYLKITIHNQHNIRFNCLKKSTTVATYVSSLRKSNSYKGNVCYLEVEYPKHNIRYENCLYSW